jgi:hypothetical protein
LLCLIALTVWVLLIGIGQRVASSDPLPDIGTEALVDKLVETTKLGFGYSAQFSGSQFLPADNAGEVNSLVLGSPAPAKSVVLEAIVRRGVAAVPALLKHLDDRRATKIPPIKGMMCMSYGDEYDFNRNTRKLAPIGVNKATSARNSGYVITVGDLCFVALGQIVNRNFNATRYQASGGVVVNSPSRSKALCEVARADFGGLTPQTHRELLEQDFLAPDSEYRRNGAYVRLAFYYPDVVEPLVVKQLAMPSFSSNDCSQFLKKTLYPAKDPAVRQQLFDHFVRSHNAAAKDGILLGLFEDLDMQEADEQGRLFPPRRKKVDARAALISLFNYPASVKGSDVPFVQSWETFEKTRFIAALAGNKSAVIDAAIVKLLSQTDRDYYIGEACIVRLIGTGYDDEIRQYCQRAIPKASKDEAQSLREIVSQLDK